MRHTMNWLVTCGLLGILGCEDTSAPPPAANKTASPSAAPLPSAPLPSAPTLPATQAPVAQPQTASPAPAAPKTEVQKAEAGVGKKGRGYGGGIVTEPVRQYFRTQQQIVFQIEIPNAMKMFKAEHDRNPKDWNEFEREILKPANIRLPDLPSGEKYTYDGKLGELMVERPAPVESTTP